MSQQQLGDAMAAMLGKSWHPQTVSAMERGLRSITTSELAALCHLLETTPAALFLPIRAVDAVQVGALYEGRPHEDRGQSIPWVSGGTKRQVAADDIRNELTVARVLAGQAQDNFAGAVALLDSAEASLNRMIGDQE
jgi:hypothetical protein